MAMTLRLSEEDSARLKARAESEGVSMQEVALTALRQYLDGATRAKLIDEALQDTLGRYATTLRRLGE